MGQKFNANFLYYLTMCRSRKMIIRQYGRKFWKSFKKISNAKFKELMKEFEDIGDSMFAFNYVYAPEYVAEFTTMEKLGLAQHDCDELMLKMNEKMLLTVPKLLLNAVGKMYYKNMAKLAENRVQNKPDKLHPFDWDIDFRRKGKDTFEIDIKTCGFIEYTKKYGGSFMLPGICRVDYLIAHYMNVGFDRTQTLGEGGTMCDCRYKM